MTSSRFGRLSAEPLVSVIVPIHNGEEYLSEALESIRSQTYEHWRVFLIDDGSTDGSPAIAHSFPEMTYLPGAHQGVAAARNRGLAEACGELVAFLDQDDRWTADKLEVQVAALRTRPEVGFALARQQIVLGNDEGWPPWAPRDWLDRELMVYIPGVLLAHRALFAPEAVGLFDTSYINTSDSDWVFRAVDGGTLRVDVERVLLLKRVHARNASRRIDVNRRELFRALRNSVHRRRAQRNSPR